MKILWWFKQIIHWKMKDGTYSVAIEEFVGLKPTTCSYLVDDKVNIKKYEINKISVVLMTKYIFKTKDDGLALGY